MTENARCVVTHAPGGHYVCWTHRCFLPWSAAWIDGPCCCDRNGKVHAAAAVKEDQRGD